VHTICSGGPQAHHYLESHNDICDIIKRKCRLINIKKKFSIHNIDLSIRHWIVQIFYNHGQVLPETLSTKLPKLSTFKVWHMRLQVEEHHVKNSYTLCYAFNERRPYTVGRLS